MGMQYVYHKSVATFLRALVRPRLHIHPKPDDTVYVPSRDEGRTIKTNIYGTEEDKPTPVLINFCGSGFVLRTFGNDDEYCRFVADKTEYTVIDVQYRLAPENTFPAAFNDAEDVVKWVQSQPGRFDASCISLSGFSAGANIALAVASSSALFGGEEHKSIFNTVVSIYGPTDMALPTPEKPLVDSSNWIMKKIFPKFSQTCHKLLNPGNVDAYDPRISPAFADPHNFPNNALFITASQCAFAVEAETLSEKIDGIDGKVSLSRRMEGCAHGWDKEAIRGSSQCKAKDEAYALVVATLQRGETEVAKAREAVA
ncbi:uncharacterized protein N7484_004617 [Penicillium longicatenatum]|uniref:uncharacterized protein n=1 Tax=Penicillium longicatenatum TaxID=1561947 RepID=UPI0025479950|nr:uncharacterized protein N7484_004617 [Penicillium longicatenatum]KAJ5650894.1 hypothetical protein N7484_004617 [Penicillium longicatenatum]